MPASARSGRTICDSLQDMGGLRSLPGRPGPLSAPEVERKPHPHPSLVLCALQGNPSLCSLLSTPAQEPEREPSPLGGHCQPQPLTGTGAPTTEVLVCGTSTLYATKSRRDPRSTNKETEAQRLTDTGRAPI